MKASAEISLYPLSEDYKERITSFILRLKKTAALEITTNGMSTQIFGEFDELMRVLTQELKTELEKHRTMVVMKIGDGIMKADKLPKELTK